MCAGVVGGATGACGGVARAGVEGGGWRWCIKVAASEAQVCAATGGQRPRRPRRSTTVKACPVAHFACRQQAVRQSTRLRETKRDTSAGAHLLRNVGVVDQRRAPEVRDAGGRLPHLCLGLLCKAQRSTAAHGMEAQSGMAGWLAERQTGVSSAATGPWVARTLPGGLPACCLRSAQRLAAAPAKPAREARFAAQAPNVQPRTAQHNITQRSRAHPSRCRGPPQRRSPPQRALHRGALQQAAQHSKHYIHTPEAVLAEHCNHPT